MIQNIKKYIIIVSLIIISLLGITSYIQYKEIIKTKNELSISKANEKAFILENTILKNENRAFKFTVEQLNYINDSITNRMNNVRKELNIKDKNLKQMQYLLSEAHKSDTIKIRDTLFIDKTLKVDTLLGDSWYQLRLGLEYPNNIFISPSFISEKYIISSYKKETITPPKKFFLSRWFQRKHKIIEVEVVEKNPYIENKQQRFIEILE